MKFLTSSIFLVFFMFTYAEELADKEYVIDLNLPPRERYTQIINDKKEVIKEIYGVIKREIPRNLWKIVASTFATVTIPKFKEYAEEIIGISQILNITATDIYVLNCFYEIDMLCTSIVARDKDNKLILARNFDFSFTPYLRKMHVTAVYKRNGVEIARCGNIAAYIGVFTCMRMGAFAVSMNARGMNNVQDFLLKLREGRLLTTWMLREAVLNAGNYKSAVRMVEGKRTVSASYITIVGVKENEGTIITRTRDSPVNIRKLSKNVWYIAQCNSDVGHVGDKRTEWVNKAMTELGQSNTSLDVILNQVLLRPPLLQSNTVATILMCPADKYFKSIIATNSPAEGNEVH
eukprot:TRINITY_DN892_c0_g6_i1.p1 TRINITY_DN892_c0_g6~~TRINITY_DN892_c0_g6_i1.p1  ORF type:complete len:384 (-),score=76.94 TRINITY_DN892_c0_g6_i1:108-1151(-)